MGQAENNSRDKETSGDTRPFFESLDNYRGHSVVIEGLQRIREVEDLSAIRVIKPTILTPTLYEAFKRLDPETFADALLNTWMDVSQLGQYPVIVRRLFPDERGERKEGPKSGNVANSVEFADHIRKLFDYYDQHYSAEGDKIEAELMAHRLIDVNTPPEAPGLPHVGGNVTCIGPGKFEVQALRGADESVQSYPKDIWHVRFVSPDKVVIETMYIDRKTDAIVMSRTAEGDFDIIQIPEEHQSAPSLEPWQILLLATACDRLTQRYGPQRIEFNQTVDGQRKVFFITESQGFKMPTPSEEMLNRFETPVTMPVIVPSSEAQLRRMVPENTIAFAHLPRESFRRSTRYDEGQAIMLLGRIAKEKKTTLIVFVQGEAANEHGGKVLWEKGHQPIWIGRETLSPDEPVRVFTRDGTLQWERENFIVYPDNIKGRGVDRIGGKAYGLVKLAEAGFNVPKHFIVDSSVFRRIIDDLGLGPKIKDLQHSNPKKIGPILASIRNEVEKYAGPVLEELRMSLEEVLTTLPADYLIVRSSANWEDVSDFSFAGHFRTVPKVTRPQATKAVLQVLSSAFRDLPITELIGAKLNPADTQMAAIVQERIDGPEIKFFTRSIVQGQEGLMRMEVSYGSKKNRKQQTVLIDKAGEIKVSGTTLLSPEKIAEIVATSQQIKNKLGKKGEMDIELVVSQETGEVYVVQARKL